MKHPDPLDCSDVESRIKILFLNMLLDTKAMIKLKLLLFFVICWETIVSLTQTHLMAEKMQIHLW